VWHYQAELKQMDTHYIAQLEKLSAEKDRVAAEAAELRGALGLQAPPPPPPAAPQPQSQPPALPPPPPPPQLSAAQQQQPGQYRGSPVAAQQAAAEAGGAGPRPPPPKGVVRAGGAVENGRRDVGNDLKALMVRAAETRCASFGALWGACMRVGRGLRRSWRCAGGWKRREGVRSGCQSYAGGQPESACGSCSRGG